MVDYAASYSIPIFEIWHDIPDINNDGKLNKLPFGGIFNGDYYCSFAISFFNYSFSYCNCYWFKFY
jgi:hypothetical protein